MYKQGCHLGGGGAEALRRSIYLKDCECERSKFCTTGKLKWQSVL